MEQKKDIGKIIEERLQDTVTAPADLKWDRVNSSLDKHDRKRRFLLILWTGIAVTGMVVLGMMLHSQSKPLEAAPVVNTDQVLPTNQLESTKLGIEEEGLLEKNVTEEQKMNATRIDIEEPVLDSEETSATSTVSAKGTKVNQAIIRKAKTTQAIVTPSEDQEWIITTSQDDISKTFTVDSVTTYRYYNHDTQNELITTNKKTIDSLVGLSEIIKDTIH